MNLNTAPEHLKIEAELVSGQYEITTVPHDRLGFVGNVKEMPTVVGHGSTDAQCVASTRHAAMVAALTMLIHNYKPPDPEPKS